MTESTEQRTRETVEGELSNATKSRDKCARELREVRGELQVKREEEAAGIESAVRSGKAPKSSAEIAKLEGREGELGRQLETLKQLVTRLDFERREFRLGELNAEVEELASQTQAARDREREAHEERIRCGNALAARKQERDNVKRSLSRKTPRSADRGSIFIRI